MKLFQQLTSFGHSVLNSAKVTSNSYQIYRYLRGNRLKNFDLDKLEKVLYEFAQQQQADKLKDTELYSEKKSKFIEEKALQNVNTELPQSKKNILKDVKTSKSSSINKDILTEENQYDMLKKVMMPFNEYPYEKQLTKKYSQNSSILRKFGSELKKHGYAIPADSANIPCILDNILPSPVTEAYRNKDEFSIRTGFDGNPKTVGFFLQSPSDNTDTICVPPYQLEILKESHKLVAKEFENYIRQSSLPACHNFFDGGHWRNIIVRSNVKGDIMATVIFHPQQLPKETIHSEMKKIKDYFFDKKEFLNIKSFYFQACPHVRCTNAQAPFHLLFGEPYIFEEVNGIKFRISPEVFFQVNTAAASVLYKVILSTCKVKNTTTILDICCGIGPISLTLASHVKNCIGIEASKEAVEDAKFNAKLNGIQNVEFYAGRTEHVLREVLNDTYAHDIVAIVNPASSALGKTAMTALRECKFLKKIIFVSCKLEAIIPNMVQLCESCGKMSSLGAHFYPIRAIPIDLFPHTSHSEMIVLFQRLQ